MTLAPEFSGPPPAFGHACRSLFGFDDEYVNVNNGSFGVAPKAVLSHFHALADRAEARPDTFLRYEFQPLLNASRSDLANLVGCDVSDLVLVPNATSGVNAVLRGMNGRWEDGDAILVYSTVYGAVGQGVAYIVDSNPTFNLRVINVELSYPVSDDEFLDATRKALDQAEGKVRLAVIDGLSSVPGVRVPWERTVALLRDRGVITVVDAAHAVGQIHLDLRKADPDFFVSNCHKWLFAHRGCAFMYAPPRNQHIPAPIPTSWEYRNPSFATRWEWTGTQDLSSFCSLSTAIALRRWLGGEAKIQGYNADLAQRGGAAAAKVLGGRWFGSEGAALVNVEVPVKHVEGAAEKLQLAVAQNHPTFVMFYAHAGSVWIRLSAQIWLEESDFTWAANAVATERERLGLAPFQPNM